MFRIGLTGGIASGKTTVCQFFSELGIDIFDADDIARELVNVGTPCYQQILGHFGTDFLLADRTLNRQQLRTHIFSNVQAKATLENILHPAIHTVLISRSAESLSPYCILAIPLLVESQQSYQLNRIILVDTPETLQQQRLCKTSPVNFTELTPKALPFPGSPVHPRKKPTNCHIASKPRQPGITGSFLK